MPIYEFCCPTCNLKFELRRSFSQAEEAARCPACDVVAKKLLSSFAAFSKGAEGESTPIGGSSCSGCASSSCASCGLG